jgi:hypothetical protein
MTTLNVGGTIQWAGDPDGTKVEGGGNQTTSSILSEQVHLSLLLSPWMSDSNFFSISTFISATLQGAFRPSVSDWD